MNPLVVLFTDFGTSDAYVGQMHAACLGEDPEVRVIDLMHEAPRFDNRASAYLLPALTRGFPPEAVFVCVVDPGVGSERLPVAVEADGSWYVGPDNGLLEMVARRAVRTQGWHIEWRPPRLSASFHGRDLFAPVGARLARDDRSVLGAPLQLRAVDWPDDWSSIIHVDHFGNTVTGLREHCVPAGATLSCRGHAFEPARTFSSVDAGRGLWLVNSSGLVELAANRSSAAERFGIVVGDPVTVAYPDL